MYKFLVAVVDLTSLLGITSFCVLGGVLASHLDSVQGPCGVFASFEGLEEMLFFLLQQLWTGAYSFCSVIKSAYHTVLRWNSVVVVPL